MIAIDTQILVYAHRSDSPWHDVARERIAELANSGSRWAIPMHCLVELYALVTNPRLFKPPATSTVDHAIDQIDHPIIRDTRAGRIELRLAAEVIAAC